MANQAWIEEGHGGPRRSGAASVVRRLAALIETCRRSVRAGQEIEALLSLSDAELAARHLKREDLGRQILAKHGIDLNS